MNNLKSNTDKESKCFHGEEIINVAKTPTETQDTYKTSHLNIPAGNTKRCIVCSQDQATANCLFYKKLVHPQCALQSTGKEGTTTICDLCVKADIPTVNDIHDLDIEEQWKGQNRKTQKHILFSKQ